MYEPTIDDRVAGSRRLHRRQVTARVLAAALGRLEISGVGKLPRNGPVLLAVNHRSMLDGPLLFGVVDRPVNCLVKSEAFVPVVAPVLRSAGQISVVRETIDPAPVRLCLEILRAGGVVGVFPEGTRGDGLVRTAKPGIGYFALRTGAPVVPVACHGSAEVAHRRGVRRPQARLVFGDPIFVEPVPENQLLNRAIVAETTEYIRRALAALVSETAFVPLPPRQGLAA